MSHIFILNFSLSRTRSLSVLVGGCIRKCVWDLISNARDEIYAWAQIIYCDIEIPTLINMMYTYLYTLFSPFRIVGEVFFCHTAGNVGFARCFSLLLALLVCLAFAFTFVQLLVAYIQTFH